MADTQGFEFNLAIGVIPEIDQRKHPDIYNECAQLRRAVRLVASALGGTSGDNVINDLSGVTKRVSVLENKVMTIKRRIENQVNLAAGVFTGVYVIVPPLTDLTKVKLTNLGAENTDTAATPSSVAARLSLTATNQLTVTRQTSVGTLIQGFEIIEFE